MEAWAPVILNKVDDDTGDLTALFPPSCSTEPGNTTAGSLRRKQTSGKLYRIEVYASDNSGGVIEFWDIDGVSEGLSNNISTGTQLTNAYKNEKVSLKQAKMIWTQSFSGDTGDAIVKFKQPVPIIRGLAARYISPTGVSCTISIVADGCYLKTEICGV
jgi:hypothetical protein